MEKQRKCIFAVILLAFGASVYVWLRPRHVLLPEWILFVLPDALWTSAYLFICDAVWSTESCRERLGYGMLVPLIGLLSEVAQRVGWLPGTFDVQDLLAYVLPYLIYCLYVIIHQKIKLWSLQASKS